LATFDIFQFCTRAEESLFHKRNDPADPRLGEVVRLDPADYAPAKVVLLGCPQDEGVRRNKARVGAALAPDEIRRYFYRLVAPSEFNFSLFDLGNLKIQLSLEETHEIQQAVVRQLIRAGKTVLVLGGGNDISYPDCSALALEVPDLLAFNIDAHFDVRFDTPRNSGTPYFQLLEEGFIQPAKFYEMANLAFSTASAHRQYLNEKGVNIYSLDELHRQGVESIFRAILQREIASTIFWGFDLDAVQASDAPGVSAPAPIGLSGEELCRLTYLAGQDRRTRLVEFSEVNPTYDIDGRTCRLVAAAMFYFLLGLSSEPVS
jgi:formiminoglutamase